MLFATGGDERGVDLDQPAAIGSTLIGKSGSRTQRHVSTSTVGVPAALIPVGASVSHPKERLDGHAPGPYPSAAERHPDPGCESIS
jgi:hypothetical protein